MNTTVRKASIFILIFLCQLLATAAPQSPADKSPAARIVGEVFADGEQMQYLSLLSDEIGSRLTGSKGAERAMQAVEAEMKRIGLANIHREPFAIPVSWERGQAAASLITFGDRPLKIASYTWTPATAGPIVGPVIEIGAGRPEDVERVRGKLKGAIALSTPSGGSLDELMYNVYHVAQLEKDLKEAGALALMIASDKPHAMLFTAPIEFKARLAALPTVSIAHEDVGLLQRMLARKEEVRVQLDVRNTVGGSFESANVTGEIPGREKPEEIVVVGAHLDSNDLGPGALDNAAGSAAVLETARAIKSLGLVPRRTIRFVLFTGEEEGMLGSNAYVRHHRDEMDRTVAALIMDIGAGKPEGWFSMGRPDLDAQIDELMSTYKNLGMSHIEHAAFAGTDNAAFMAEGIPTLVLLQDETSYFPVLHTVADTVDKADPRDFASCVAALAATAYAIADRPDRFGRRLTVAEVRKLAAETKIDAQWRAVGIWP